MMLSVARRSVGCPQAATMTEEHDLLQLWVACYSCDVRRERTDGGSNEDSRVSTSTINMKDKRFGPYPFSAQFARVKINPFLFDS